MFSHPSEPRIWSPGHEHEAEEAPGAALGVAATEEVSGQEQSPPSKAHASLLHAVSQRPLFSEPIWQLGAHSKAMGLVEALSAKIKKR
jgi:hypothetical protein